MLNAAVIINVAHVIKRYGIREGQYLRWQDIENLINGFSISGENLRVVVKRAYADFDDPKLADLRTVFARLAYAMPPLSKNTTANETAAAWVEDTLFTDVSALLQEGYEPSINLFVIVTGDTVLSETAKMLMANGKHVISLAYETAVSINLSGVCSILVPLPRVPGRSNLHSHLLSGDEISAGEAPPYRPSGKVDLYWEAVRESGIQPPDAHHFDEVKQYALAMLDVLRLNKKSATFFANNGIYLSKFSVYMKQHWPSFDCNLLGIAKPRYFINAALYGTDYRVVEGPNSINIVHRYFTKPGFKDIEMRPYSFYLYNYYKFLASCHDPYSFSEAKFLFNQIQQQEWEPKPGDEFMAALRALLPYETEDAVIYRHLRSFCLIGPVAKSSPDENTSIYQIIKFDKPYRETVTDYIRQQLQTREISCDESILQMLSEEIDNATLLPLGMERRPSVATYTDDTDEPPINSCVNTNTPAYASGWDETSDPAITVSTVATYPQVVTSASAAESDGTEEPTAAAISVTKNALTGFDPDAKHITVPTGITKITYRMFADYPLLESVTLPESVTEIDYHAFNGCTRLASISIPESVVKVDWFAFTGCPEALTVYGALNSYIREFIMTESGLPEAPDEQNSRFTFTVTVDGHPVDHTALTAVDISEGCAVMYDYAFAGCAALESIKIPEGVQSIGKKAFYGCHALKTVRLPESLTHIDREAFSDCYALQSIVIPDKVSEIGDDAFKRCGSDSASNETDTQAFTVYAKPDSCAAAYAAREGHRFIPIIGDYTFDAAGRLTAVVIYNDIQTIENRLFADCPYLTSITLPASVSRIGAYAFAGCSALQHIQFSSGLTEIGEYAFSGCKALTRLILPDNVSQLGKGAFNDCTALTKITIAGQIRTIQPETFAGCVSLNGVILSENLEEIGVKAFHGCGALAQLLIPDCVTRIHNNAFQACAPSFTLRAGKHSCAKKYARTFRCKFEPIK